MMTLVGLGEIGMIVTSLCLVTSDLYVDPAIRGSVAGCYSLFGGLGLLVSTKVGGLLFDQWKNTAPFMVMGLFAGICAAVSLAVVAREAVVRRSLTPPLLVADQEIQ